MNTVGQSNIEVDGNGQRRATYKICRCDCCIHCPCIHRYEVMLVCINSKETEKDVVNVDEPSDTVSLLGNVIVNGVQNGVELAQ